jgi:chromate reductase
VRVLAIPGSLRAGSHNAALLRAAAASHDDVEIVIFDELRAIPPFDEDAEMEPTEAVERLRAAVADADAVLIATPEYNGSIPGALKNALDWTSRPLDANPFRGKTAAVVSASTGSFGALWAQNDLRRVLGTMGARVIESQVVVPYVHQRVNDVGELHDAETRAQLAELVRELHASGSPVAA